jgi:hypothetical protein
MAREGLLDAGQKFVFHGSDDSSDYSPDSFGGDEDGQACGDDTYADIAGVVPLQ